MRGVIIARDGASEIDAFGSMNNGATQDLQLMVGFWFNMMDNQTQGYMIENGVFTSSMVPGSNATSAWDVNPDGAIVGQYSVGTTLRGFVKTGETYTTIHYPGSIRNNRLVGGSSLASCSCNSPLLLGAI